MARLEDLDLGLWILICGLLDPRGLCLFRASCTLARAASAKRNLELQTCLAPLTGRPRSSIGAHHHRTHH